MGSRDEKDSQQGGNWQTQEVADCGMGWARLQLEHPTGRWLADPAAPHLRIDKPDKWQGAKQTEQPRAPAWGNKASNL